LVLALLIGAASRAGAADCADAVRKVISEHMEPAVGKVVPRARFKEDLQADELDMVEIVIAVEEEFGVLISQTDEKGFVTVADLIAFVNARAKKGCK
jgi:acyl carrier protein